MNDTETAMLPEPTSDEKTMATLAQVLQIIGSWIAPLIIYLIKRESKFVSFHAMQALLWQVVVLIVWMGAMFVWFGVIFSLVFAHGGHPQPSNMPPIGMFLGIGAIWLVVMTIGMTNLFLAIFYGIKAGNGKWAEYPIIGKLARRIVGV
jgi:uncharacterized membrane protein